MPDADRSSADYIDRTIATVRNHRDADNCWPQWANLFADEIEYLRKDVARAVYLGEHLHQMIPREVWRDHGAEWMGQYEGDYHAEQVRDELAALGSRAKGFE